MLGFLFSLLSGGWSENGQDLVWTGYMMVRFRRADGVWWCGVWTGGGWKTQGCDTVCGSVWTSEHGIARSWKMRASSSLNVSGPGFCSSQIVGGTRVLQHGRHLSSKLSQTVGGYYGPKNCGNLSGQQLGHAAAGIFPCVPAKHCQSQSAAIACRCVSFREPDVHQGCVIYVTISIAEKIE